MIKIRKHWHTQQTAFAGMLKEVNEFVSQVEQLVEKVNKENTNISLKKFRADLLKNVVKGSKIQPFIERCANTYFLNATFIFELVFYLNIEIPKNFYNIAVSENNHLIADTNDSVNWDTIKIPLPKGKWYILSIEGKNVFLHKKYV